MTPSTACQLRDALRDEISTEITSILTASPDHPFGSPWVGSRYLPRTDRHYLDRLHVSLYLAMTKPGYFASGRNGDEDDHMIEIAFCQAVNAVPTGPNGKPDISAVDNTHFGDALLGLVDQIKTLWRPETEDDESGRLRNKQLAGCDFISLVHDPVIEPEPLLKTGVLAVVLSATYRQGF